MSETFVYGAPVKSLDFAGKRSHSDANGDFQEKREEVSWKSESTSLVATRRRIRTLLRLFKHGF